MGKLMSVLSAYLAILRDGGSVSLDQRENQYGEAIVVLSLQFEAGAWLLTRLNCHSSQDVGFGTCRCQSHPSWVTERVSRKVALEHLRELGRRKVADVESRTAEMAWLDKAISELVD